MFHSIMIGGELLPMNLNKWRPKKPVTSGMPSISHRAIHGEKPTACHETEPDDVRELNKLDIIIVPRNTMSKKYPIDYDRTWEVRKPKKLHGSRW